MFLRVGLSAFGDQQRPPWALYAFSDDIPRLQRLCMEYNMTLSLDGPGALDFFLSHRGSLYFPKTSIFVGLGATLFFGEIFPKKVALSNVGEIPGG